MDEHRGESAMPRNSVDYDDDFYAWTAIARARAIADTGLAEATFPENCPFTLDEVLSRSFLPEA
jgi:hypothetical protein